MTNKTTTEQLVNTWYMLCNRIWAGNGNDGDYAMLKNIFNVIMFSNQYNMRQYVSDDDYHFMWDKMDEFHNLDCINE